MLTKTLKKQSELSVVILEDLVPNDHLLRKIDKVIDFSFIYPYIEHLYSPIGRPSIDPVVLIKLAFLDKLYGFHSMRRTCKEVEVNLAFKWFLGFGIEEKTPHFSDFSKTYTRKFSQLIEVKDQQDDVAVEMSLFEVIFNKIIYQAMKHGYVDVSHVYMDSTHIKANANKKKFKEVEVLESVRSYQKELDHEVNQLCEKNNWKQAKEVEQASKVRKQSTIDEDCGVFRKGEHETQMAYLSQTVCDKNGFILGLSIHPANLHDSTTCHELFNEITTKYKGIKSIGIDAGYKTPGVSRMIIESGITPLMPYTRPKGNRFNEEKETKMGKKEFTYDKASDTFVCPMGRVLRPTKADKKNGYVHYQSNAKECLMCPRSHECLSKTSTKKTVFRHVWQEYLDKVELIRKTEYWQRYYPQRKKTIELVFADAKEKHGMRFVRVKGKQKVLDDTRIVFACMNLKKLANWAWKNTSIACEYMTKIKNHTIYCKQKLGFLF